MKLCAPQISHQGLIFPSELSQILSRVQSHFYSMDKPGWKPGKDSSHAEPDGGFCLQFLWITSMFCCTWLTDISSITDLNTLKIWCCFHILPHQSFLFLTEITFSANRVFRTPIQNTPDLPQKILTVEQSCIKLPNTTGIFRIYYLNTQKYSFSATSFTDKARKRQMLCFSRILFRALKPPQNLISKLITGDGFCQVLSDLIHTFPFWQNSFF